MGKALNTVAAVAVAVGVFVATGGNVTAAQAAFVLTTAALTVLNPGKAPKPDTTTTGQRQPIPPRVRAYGRSRLHAYFALYATASDGSTIDVLAYMDGQADGIEQVYLNDEKVTVANGIVQALPDKKYQGNHVLAGWTLGPAVNTAFAAVTALFPKWTANHRGDAVVTGYLIKKPDNEKHFLETYPQGDNVEMSLVGRWQPCFDPRTGGTAWTENSILHTLDYLTRIRGYDYDKRIAPTLAYWIEAANVCEQAVPLKGGGTEPRYRSCASYNATSPEKEVLASLLETCDGWMQERGDGAFIIHAGVVTTPTVTIGPDDIISSSIQNFVQAENQVDQVKVTYISADHDYNEVECTPWGGENGTTKSASLSAQTPSFSQNRRLAKRLMSRTNAPQRGTITTGLAGRRIRGHRYITLNHVESGMTFYSGLAEITGIRRDFQQGGVSFDWIAADENIDDWNPATEEGEGAASEDRVAPEPVEPAIITDVQPIFAAATDEGTGVRLQAIVSAPDRTDLTWYLRWKRTEAAVWNESEYPDQDASSSVTLVTGFVPANASIDVQAEYRQGDGRLSEWSATYVVSTATDAAPPDTATAVTLTGWSDTLDLVTDLIPRARSYRWRFYAADGTTLVRTITTSVRSVSYTSQQAAVDGARRAYIVRVAGVNGAGAGADATTGTLSLPAPVAVAGVSATGGDYNAEIDFTEQPGVAGYSVAYSTETGFDPLTQGTIQKSLASPTYLQGLAAGTFYAKVAAFDAWTDRPDLLNYSAEVTFAIAVGGGGTGGGGGGGGGGYCPHENTPILMADGTQKRAGSLVVGDMVWTQHEETFEWGAYPVSAVTSHHCDDMWRVSLGIGFRASGEHRIWLSGWVQAKSIGEPCEPGTVVRITVDDAHTYVSAGVLSHNAKSYDPEP